MADQFEEWDRFSEMMDGSMSVEAAWNKYRKARRKTGTLQDEAELSRYSRDLRREKATGSSD
jgi:hypothetical protein